MSSRGSGLFFPPCLLLLRDLVAIIAVLEFNQWFIKLSTKDYKLVSMPFFVLLFVHPSCLFISDSWETPLFSSYDCYLRETISYSREPFLLCFTLICVLALKKMDIQVSVCHMLAKIWSCFYYILAAPCIRHYANLLTGQCSLRGQFSLK